MSLGVFGNLFWQLVGLETEDTGESSINRHKDIAQVFWRNFIQFGRLGRRIV